MSETIPRRPADHKLAAKDEANAEAQTAALEPVDYVAKMDKRRWIASRFFLPPLVMGFVGLFFIGGNCTARGWAALEAYQPLLLISWFCILAGIFGHFFTQRCPKCEKLFQGSDGISLIVPDECPNCGAQLR